MTDDPLAFVVVVGGILIWSAVAYRAWRTGASIELLALVLIVVGLLTSGLLGGIGIRYPSGWAFAAVGLILFLVWPHRKDA